MSDLKFFLSVVSDEFKSYRVEIEARLARGRNVSVMTQEKFGPVGLGTLAKLDSYIRDCTAVVHLVGDMTGSAPPPAAVRALLGKYPDLLARLELDKSGLATQSSPLSYTQWEAYLAIFHDKELFIAEPKRNAKREKGTYRYDPEQVKQQQTHRAHLQSLDQWAEIKFVDAEDITLDLLFAQLNKHLSVSLTQPAPSGQRRAPEPTATVDEVSKYLLRQLDLLDSDFDFDNAWFTPLEAQVRIRNDSYPTNDNVVDLLTGLTNYSSERLCIVLGLPGAGKSVALREFARQGLAKVTESGVMPIYVNLRDWLPDQNSGKPSPSTMTDLEKFLAHTLTFPNNPRVTAYFADFIKLHEDSKILWLFDSFDEMPIVLDAGSARNAEPIKLLSRLLDDFLRRGKDGSRKLARGVIASRYERKPELPAKFFVRLDLQPFSDDRIRDAFAKIGGFPEPLSDDIFRPPGNLVSLARTPFYHNLIADYSVSTKNLPRTTTELFEAYVQRRLERIEGASSQALHSTVTVAEEIAGFLFDSTQFGLGGPLAVLKQGLANQDLEPTLARLQRAQLIRRGSAPNEIVCFSHRRLHEYFFTRWRKRLGVPFELEAVAGDGRERDAAVLRVELADDTEAQQIALALWEEIRKGERSGYNDPQFSRSLHCLRFLVEAFRSRRNALECVRTELENMVSRQLEYGEDLISVKLAVEALGLLPTKGVEKNILAVLRRGDYWLREAAIDACRFLPALPANVVGDVWRCLAFLPDAVFVRDLNSLKFSFRLSPSLQEIPQLIEARARDIHWWRRWGWWMATLSRSVFAVSAYLYFKASAANPKRSRLDSERERLGQIRELKQRARDVRQTLEILTDHLQRIDHASNHSENGGSQPTALPLTGAGVGRVTRELLANIKSEQETAAAIERELLKSFAQDPIRLYISDSKMFSTHKIELEPMPITDRARWLPSINIDRTFGLERYRAFLASFGRNWYGLAFLAVVVNFIILIFGQVPSTIALAALPVCVFSLLSPYFSRRAYDLMIPQEKQIYRTWKVTPVGWAESFGVSSLFLGLLAVMYWLGITPDTVPPAIRYIWFGVAIAFVCWLFYGDIKERFLERRRSSQDADKFRRVWDLGQTSRSQIAEQFLSFTTPYWREAYVDRLEKDGIVPTGDWPSGRPPNVGDPASTKLAKLEYTWRGFDK